METEYVSREMIRAIAPGSKKVFYLPNAAKCYSARVQVSMVKAIHGGDYECHIYSKTNTVVILRVS